MQCLEWTNRHSNYLLSLQSNSKAILHSSEIASYSYIDLILDCVQLLQYIYINAIMQVSGLSKHVGEGQQTSLEMNDDVIQENQVLSGDEGILESDSEIKKVSSGRGKYSHDGNNVEEHGEGRIQTNYRVVMEAKKIFQELRKNSSVDFEEGGVSSFSQRQTNVRQQQSNVDFLPQKLQQTAMMQQILKDERNSIIRMSTMTNQARSHFINPQFKKQEVSERKDDGEVSPLKASVSARKPIRRQSSIPLISEMPISQFEHHDPKPISENYSRSSMNVGSPFKFAYNSTSKRIQETEEQFSVTPPPIRKQKTVFDYKLTGKIEPQKYISKNASGSSSELSSSLSRYSSKSSSSDDEYFPQMQQDFKATLNARSPVKSMQVNEISVAKNFIIRSETLRQQEFKELERQSDVTPKENSDNQIKHGSSIEFQDSAMPLQVEISGEQPLKMYQQAAISKTRFSMQNLFSSGNSRVVLENPKETGRENFNNTTFDVTPALNTLNESYKFENPNVDNNGQYRKSGKIRHKISYLDSKEQEGLEYENYYAALEANDHFKLRDYYKDVARKFILFPDDHIKQRWEVIISLVLVFTAIQTPYRLAFYENDDLLWICINYLVDFLFLLDIIISFFSAYEDSDTEELVHNRKVIALGYLKSWFIIDLTSIIPIAEYIETTNYHRVSRLARLPKLYRLIRLFKLIRLLKLIKERNNISNQLSEIFQISAATERLVFFAFMYALLVHIISCCWIIIGSFEDDDNLSFIIWNNLQNRSIMEQYLAGFYYTTAIVATIGYGDITVRTHTEQAFCMIILINGVIGFSFGIGSLTSMLSSMDSKVAKLKNRNATLEEIRQDFRLPYELYRRLRKSLSYEYSKNADEEQILVEELPQTLRVELSVLMNKGLVRNINFFKNKSPHFISFIAPLLRPMRIDKNQYVYKEGDPIDEIYFLVSGQVGYALPDYDNQVFVLIDKGYYFGEIDFIYQDDDGQNDGKRKFSAYAVEECDMLSLSKKNLLATDQKFEDVISDLFENSMFRLKKTMKLKRKSIRYMKHSKQPLVESESLGESSSQHLEDEVSGIFFKERAFQNIKNLKQNKQICTKLQTLSDNAPFFQNSANEDVDKKLIDTIMNLQNSVIIDNELIREESIPSLKRSTYIVREKVIAQNPIENEKSRIQLQDENNQLDNSFSISQNNDINTQENQEYSPPAQVPSALVSNIDGIELASSNISATLWSPQPRRTQGQSAASNLSPQQVLNKYTRNNSYGALRSENVDRKYIEMQGHLRWKQMKQNMGKRQSIFTDGGLLKLSRTPKPGEDTDNYKSNVLMSPAIQRHSDLKIRIEQEKKQAQLLVQQSIRIDNLEKLIVDIQTMLKQNFLKKNAAPEISTAQETNLKGLIKIVLLEAGFGGESQSSLRSRKVSFN